MIAGGWYTANRGSAWPATGGDHSLTRMANKKHAIQPRLVVFITLWSRLDTYFALSSVHIALIFCRGLSDHPS